MLERPAARFVFVVGKGGVGKSTTAAGLALAWADAGRTVHLVSTDPAHSLADVLGRGLEPGRIDSVCARSLTVEELDAEARAAQWLAELRAPLTELFEQGSYLDAEDVARFATLRLPGVDEVMAALRLVELADAEASTIVVDTAPTGHTLRLLDAGAVLRSWAELLEALASKAAVVASALTGRAFAGPATALRTRIQAQLARFDARVLRAAACVLVTRSGAPVAAESARLRRALAARGLPVQATIHVGGDAGADAVRVPWLSPAPRGCAALRAWHAALARPGGRGSGVSGQGTSPAERARAPISAEALAGSAAAAWLRALPQRLLLFVGKGGVGKSTCAAAASFALAGRGPVLLLSADPAGSLSDILERDVGADPGAVAPGLRAAQIDAAAALAAWRAEFRGAGDALLARVGLGGDPGLDRRVLEAVWNVAPPGMDELVALAALVDVAGTEETVVLDAAPTGHLLRLLALPETAQQWTHAAMRTLLKNGVGELDALAARLIAFARQLKQFRHMLADAGRTGAIIVTLDEPVVRAETDRLQAALVQAGVPLVATLTNRSSARRSTAPQRVPQLRAPAWPEPPRGGDGLRQFVSRWELE